MPTQMTERAKARQLGRRIGLVVVLLWDLFFVGMGIRVAMNGWAEGAAVWFVLAALFVALTVFYCRDRKAGGADPVRTSNAPFVLEQQKDADASGFVELLRSTDLAQVEAVRSRLRAGGIEVSSRDEHAATGLGMIPGISIRLLVRKEDLARSTELLSED